MTITKTCRLCGDEFTAYKDMNRTVYCSKDCQIEHNNEHFFDHFFSDDADKFLSGDYGDTL